MTLYYHGAILPMDGSKPAEALLTQGETILAVGREAALRALAGKGCEEVDLHGGALLPGFIDAHSHFTQFAGSLRLASLASCKCFADIVAALGTFAAQNPLPEHAWIIGFGYDHNALRERRHPTRALLDEVSQAHPVLISHASGHMGCVNTAALAAADITASAKDPQGGRIGRDETGAPTGYLEENAFMQLAAAAPQPTPKEMRRLMKKAQEIYFSYGVTTAQEGLLRETEASLLRGMDAAGALLLDVVGYADIKNAPALAQDAAPEPGAHFRVGGYKLFLDGSPQGRTAWMTEPYAPQPGQPADYRGYPIYKDAQQAHEAAARSLGVPACGISHRNVIVHAQLLRADQLPTVKRLRLIPSFFVAHTFYWGDAHLSNFGPERGNRISPVASAAALGLPFTFHMDSPVLPPSALECVQCAVLRQTRAGVPLAQTEAVNVGTALLGVTKNGAYQYFEEDRKGTLTPGKAADLVVLAENPLTVSPSRLASLRILRTVKRGVPVYEAP